MVTAGVLVGLFVVWQLWWTDVQAGRVQADLLHSLDWAEPPSVVVEDAGVGEPPVVPVPAAGELFGLLYVPAWDDEPRTILQGVDKATVLDSGSAGHYPATVGPGEVGNFSLAGHRTTYGKPFSQIDVLAAGDPLVVRTEEAWYVYEVTATQIVQPSEVGVVAPIPQGSTHPGRYLTLTACHPRYSAAERYVVHGELVRWAPVSAGTPTELAQRGRAEAMAPPHLLAPTGGR